MVFRDYAKQRILTMYWKGLKISAIVEHLVLEDGIRVSKQGCRRFLKCYHHYKTIARKPGSGVPPKLSIAVRQLKMPCSKMLKQLLLSFKRCWLNIKSTSLWRQTGSWICVSWVSILPANTKRKYRKASYLGTRSPTWHIWRCDLEWRDNSSIRNSPSYVLREGEKPRSKPCPKHPVKVHV